MDPVSAVGFAASILTFVDFSWSLLKGSYEVYQFGTTSDNARITTVLGDLEGITKSLQSDVKGNSLHLKDLKSLAVECVKVSRELSVILKELEIKEGNKIWRSLEAKWKSMRKEKDIASIEQRLIEYRLQLLLRLNLMLRYSLQTFHTYIADPKTNKFSVSNKPRSSLSWTTSKEQGFNYRSTAWLSLPAFTKLFRV
jgi:hypothetical protein